MFSLPTIAPAEEANLYTISWALRKMDEISTVTKMSIERVH